ncbi:hypothetical protein IGI04_017992 [Brassica rapa subsp. trilocularis]|uniref:RNase H type-1 domain-containing protein n=1 Tax=Brassica rapa subsp. trilocularis TaxID=1813537 RepID=A0ABQ7MDE4_BRACM|nr:hypothetical protein IGI04_017992 [Brassica rapa subsp. trilocularis]
MSSRSEPFFEKYLQSMKLELPSVTFMSDCTTLIRAISTPNQLKKNYGVFQDIKSLSTSFDSIVFNHISRSQKSDADFLAKQVLKSISNVKLHFFLQNGIKVKME